LSGGEGIQLEPINYLRSTRLREWARRNKNSKYIPEPLLEAWGFEIESTLTCEVATENSRTGGPLDFFMSLRLHLGRLDLEAPSSSNGLGDVLEFLFRAPTRAGAWTADIDPAQALFLHHLLKLRDVGVIGPNGSGLPSFWGFRVVLPWGTVPRNFLG